MSTTEPSEGYYSLIQYCPDRGRAEGVNVGVLLFAPRIHRLDVLRVRKLGRLNRVFGREHVDTPWVRLALRSFIDALRADAARGRFQTLDDLTTFIASRANEFVVTPPRGARIDDFTADLDRLFKTYVADTAAPGDHGTGHSAMLLHRTFEKLKSEGKQVAIRFDARFEGLDHRLRSDYMFLNGTANLVRCLNLEENPKHAITEAVRLAAEGQLVARHGRLILQRKPRLIIVALADEPERARPTERQVRSVLGGFEGTELIDADQVDRFAERVEREAH